MNIFHFSLIFMASLTSAILYYVYCVITLSLIIWWYTYSKCSYKYKKIKIKTLFSKLSKILSYQVSILYFY